MPGAAAGLSPTPAVLAAGDRAVMIDRSGTPDRDDAIWVTPVPGGWRASVHVADVARHIHGGSRFDIDAADRGWTKYLPDRTIGMLPRRVEAAATLADGARTCLITLGIGADGVIEEIQVSRSRIGRAIAMDYEHAAALRTGPVGEMLAAAHNLARVRLARRRDEGALAIYDLTRGVATDEEGNLVRLDEPERNSGYVIVAELMIAANEAVARWAVRDLPILYRNHRASAVAPPRDQILADALQTPGGLERARERLAVVLKSAEYAPQISGHYGLNLPAYAHATSPLRRYADLVTQRIILAAVDGRPCPYTTPQAAQIADDLNDQTAERHRRITERHKEAARKLARADAASASFTDLNADQWHKALKIAVRENRRPPALMAEIASRAEAARLDPRDAHLLLCAADPSWRDSQLAAQAAVAAAPNTALSILAIHAAAHPPEWDITLLDSRPPGYRAHVSIVVDAARLGSAARTAPSKREARQQAALSLLCRIAGLDDVSADVSAEVAAPPVPVEAADPPAISILNTHAQGGRVTGLDWSFTADGPGHGRVFTCTARADAAAGPVEGTGTASSKAAAKAAAAAQLLAAFEENR